MTFDPSLEPPIPLSRVPELPWLPSRRNGSSLHVSTLHRWVTTGVRGEKLVAAYFGGGLCTSEARLKDFFDRVTKVTLEKVREGEEVGAGA